MIILLLAVVSPLHAHAQDASIVVEIVAFYDDAFSQAFQDLITTTRKSDFISILLNSVSQKLHLLLPEVNVTLFLAKVNMESTFVTDLTHRNIIKIPKDMEAFKKSQQYDTEVKYADLVLLITGETIIYEDPKKGQERRDEYLVKGSLCTQNKYLLVKIKPTFNDYTLSLMRDILQVLNADMDGEGSATSCPAKEKKLMARVLEPKVPFQFSTCTKTCVKSYVGNLDESCKKRNFGKSYGKYDKKKLPGELFTRDKACHSLKATKHDCTSEQDKRECKYACCEGRTSSHATTFFDGGACQDRKKCINAQCVA